MCNVDVRRSFVICLKFSVIFLNRLFWVTDYRKKFILIQKTAVILAAS